MVKYSYSYMLKKYRKTTLLKKRGPQIWLCLFMFRSITLKQINSLTTTNYVPLPRWSRCNASDCGAKSLGFGSRLCQTFHVVCFLFWGCDFGFFVQNTCFAPKLFKCLLQCKVMLVSLHTAKCVTDYKSVTIQT